MSLIIAKNSRETHAAVLDEETAVHFGLGLSAAAIGVTPTAAVLADIAVEAAIRSVKEGPRRALFQKAIPASSLANHAADVLATVAGFYTGRFLLLRFAAR